MTKVQIIPGSFNITDPAWPRYEFVRTGEALVSDGFTIDGWLGGQDTDNAFGGTPTGWINAQYVSQAWQVTGGQAVWDKTGTVFLPTPQSDYDMEVKFDALPTAASDVVNVQARRMASTTQYAAATVKGNGQVTLKTYDGTSIVESSPAATTLAPGGTITVRVIGGNISVLIGSEVVLTSQVTEWASDRVGLNATSAAGTKLGHVKIIAR